LEERNNVLKRNTRNSIFSSYLFSFADEAEAVEAEAAAAAMVSGEWGMDMKEAMTSSVTSALLF